MFTHSHHQEHLSDKIQKHTYGDRTEKNVYLKHCLCICFYTYMCGQRGIKRGLSMCVC